MEWVFTRWTMKLETTLPHSLIQQHPDCILTMTHFLHVDTQNQWEVTDSSMKSGLSAFRGPFSNPYTSPAYTSPQYTSPQYVSQSPRTNIGSPQDLTMQYTNTRPPYNYSQFDPPYLTCCGSSSHAV